VSVQNILISRVWKIVLDCQPTTIKLIVLTLLFSLKLDFNTLFWNPNFSTLYYIFSRYFPL